MNTVYLSKHLQTADPYSINPEMPFFFFNRPIFIQYFLLELLSQAHIENRHFHTWCKRVKGGGGLADVARDEHRLSLGGDSHDRRTVALLGVLGAPPSPLLLPAPRRRPPPPPPPSYPASPAPLSEQQECGFVPRTHSRAAVPPSAARCRFFLRELGARGRASSPSMAQPITRH